MAILSKSIINKETQVVIFEGKHGIFGLLKFKSSGKWYHQHLTLSIRVAERKQEYFEAAKQAYIQAKKGSLKNDNYYTFKQLFV